MKVILLKEQGDDYETLLTSNGFQVEFLQILQPEFINSKSILELKANYLFILDKYLRVY